MDQLRKDARRLEQEIEGKLVSYTKITANVSTRRSSTGSYDGWSSNHSSKENGANNSNVETMTVEMEGLLGRLQEVVQAMSRCVNEDVNGVSNADEVQVERHMEILRDYAQEYRKARMMWTSAREHKELLAGARIDLGKRGTGSIGGGGGDGDALYVERKSLANATQGADNAIGAGLNLREDLERQRAMFASMMGRMENMSESMPVINRIITQIRRKKKRDVLIMAAVVAFLLFLTIIFTTRGDKR